MTQRNFYYRLDNLGFAWSFFDDEKLTMRIRKTLRFLIKGSSCFEMMDPLDI